MRLNELFQVTVGLFLWLSVECGRTDHVHLKIHVPDIVHKHKHVKTKFVHVFHPKVIHTDHHTSAHFLHSRNDPNVGAFPHNLHNTEYRISEEDFSKWQQKQQRKALEKHKKAQRPNIRDDEDDYEESADEEDEPIYDEDLYKKHKANKANSAALSKKESGKNHRNHNYSVDYDSSNSDKQHFAKQPTRKPSGKKPRPIRPAKHSRPDDLRNYQAYGITNVDAESSNLEQQYSSIDPTAVDPGFYSTLPRDVQSASANQDDIYSGLLARKYNKNIEDKSKLLADINYSRKQQTKNLIQRRRGQ